MLQRVVLLLYNTPVNLFFNASTGEHPVHLVVGSRLGGHAVTALPVGGGAEVNVKIHNVVSLLQGDALAPADYL